ncbi:hypothetical protein CBR_g20282 [Chara braunii]|uniref:Reverse transcriptase n=1 Tax=Chara braunii TaxID=69332 RepID=A0A388L030_CHABU|nr:hypothetical protein CBR_g20282 [Chara braunii]|eukprot:GBG75655.1 hypothetical protein CBR_g20282 [Chara braunii]
MVAAMADAGGSTMFAEVVGLVEAFIKKHGLKKTLKSLRAECNLDPDGKVEGDLEEIYKFYKESKTSGKKRKSEWGPDLDEPSKKTVRAANGSAVPVSAERVSAEPADANGSDKSTVEVNPPGHPSNNLAAVDSKRKKAALASDVEDGGMAVVPAVHQLELVGSGKKSKSKKQKRKQHEQKDGQDEKIEDVEMEDAQPKDGEDLAIGLRTPEVNRGHPSSEDVEQEGGRTSEKKKKGKKKKGKEGKEKEEEEEKEKEKEQEEETPDDDVDMSRSAYVDRSEGERKSEKKKKKKEGEGKREKGAEDDPEAADDKNIAEGDENGRKTHRSDGEVDTAVPADVDERERERKSEKKKKKNKKGKQEKSAKEDVPPEAADEENAEDGQEDSAEGDGHREKLFSDDVVDMARASSVSEVAAAATVEIPDGGGVVNIESDDDEEERKSEKKKKKTKKGLMKDKSDEDIAEVAKEEDDVGPSGGGVMHIVNEGPEGGVVVDIVSDDEEERGESEKKKKTKKKKKGSKDENGEGIADGGAMMEGNAGAAGEEMGLNEDGDGQAVEGTWSPEEEEKREKGEKGDSDDKKRKKKDKHKTKHKLEESEDGAVDGGESLVDGTGNDRIVDGEQAMDGAKKDLQDDEEDTRKIKTTPKKKKKNKKKKNNEEEEEVEEGKEIAEGGGGGGGGEEETDGQCMEMDPVLISPASKTPGSRNDRRKEVTDVSATPNEKKPADTERNGGEKTPSQPCPIADGNGDSATERNGPTPNSQTPREREAAAAARAADIADQVALLRIPEANVDRFREELAAAVAALVRLRTLEDFESRMTALEQRNEELQAKLKQQRRAQGSVELTFFKLLINRRYICVLIDSGLTTNFFSSNGIRKAGLGMKQVELQNPCRTQVGNQEVVTSTHAVKGVRMTFDKDRTVTHELNFYVLDMCPFDAVIGLGWLKAHCLRTTWADNQFVVLDAKGNERTVLLDETRESPVTLLSANKFCRSVRRRKEAGFVHIALVKPFHVPSTFAALSTSEGNSTSTTSTFVPPTSAVNDRSSAEPNISKPVVIVVNSQSDFLSLDEDDPPPEIPANIRHLLDRFPEVLAEPRGVPECPVKHKIEIIEGSVPPKGCVYRMGQGELEELRRQIDDMIDRGWIRPSESEFDAPVLFVPKKGGKLRMCIDYRGLNRITRNNAYPLPRIDDLLDAAGGCKVFSKIDLKSGYHQIEVDPSDQHKTAFKTRNGLYEFIVMPFGLTNAPATFQSLMDKVLRHQLNRFVVVYLDDILIFSRSMEKHVKHLEEVLQVLKDAQLHLNLEKSEFGRDSVIYLGHQMSASGLEPEATKSISIDFTDMGKVSEAENSQVMVIVDRFSKVLNLIPLPPHAPTELVIEEFHQQYILQSGVPKTIVSDRDTRFISKDWKDFTSQIYDIKLNRTSGRHPEANGLAEEINQTVIQLLRALIVPDQNTWDKELHKVKGMYNNSIHSATGVTPNQLQYGWPMRNPLSYLFPERSPGLMPGMPGYNAKYARLLKAATAAMNKRQHAMIKHANKRRKEEKFKVGDYVWVKMSEFSDEEGISRKLLPLYYGPWQILKVEFASPKLMDNSYWAKDGAEVGWGAKAQEVLGKVKGKNFRHEKTKKKRGSYKGGIIDTKSYSIKFENSDSE